MGDNRLPARLVFIRHGESARNLAKGHAVFVPEEVVAALRDISDVDNPLTAEGWRQARATGEALRTQFGAPDCVYHSGYCRTVETTQGILSAYPDDARGRIDIRPHLFIRERDVGYTFHMTAAESAAAFPWLEDYWRTHGNFFARPPGGESLAEVTQRVHLFLESLRGQHAGQTVFVVTHGGTLRCVRYLIESWTHADIQTALRPENCAVTTYTDDGGARGLVLEAGDQVFWR